MTDIGMDIGSAFSLTLPYCVHGFSLDDGHCHVREKTVDQTLLDIKDNLPREEAGLMAPEENHPLLLLLLK